MKKLFFVFAVSMIAISSSFAFSGMAIVSVWNGASASDFKTYTISSKVVNFNMELVDLNTRAYINVFSTSKQSSSYNAVGLTDGGTIFPSGVFNLGTQPYSYYEVQLLAYAKSDLPTAPYYSTWALAWVRAWY